MKLNSILYSFITILLVAIIGIYSYQVYELKNVNSGVGNCVPFDYSNYQENGEYFLRWRTASECLGYVKFGSTEGNYPYLSLDLEGKVKKTEHVVKLSGINDDSSYYFVIISDEKVYGLNGKPIFISF